MCILKTMSLLSAVAPASGGHEEPRGGSSEPPHREARLQTLVQRSSGCACTLVQTDENADQSKERPTG